MKINNREYGFSIEPCFGKLRAEIYSVLDKDIHRYLIHKNFGRWWRLPQSKDYKEARDWAESQIWKIFIANKPIEI